MLLLRQILTTSILVFFTFSLAAQKISMNLPELNLGCINSLSDIPGPAPDEIDVNSDCREPNVRHVEDIPTNKDCNYNIKRVYTAIDACGNETIDTQNILFVYDTFPPEDVTILIDLGCNPNLRESIPDPKKFIPGHCEALQEWLGDEKNNDGCYYSLTRKFKITPCSGDTYTYTQVYNWIKDTQPPKIKCEKNIDLGCNPIAFPTPSPEKLTVTDNCCLDTVFWFQDIIISSSECTQQRIRQYKAIDCCGNESICEQTITWTSDITPPVIVSCPTGKDLGCIPDFNVNKDLPLPTPDVVKALDSCSSVQITYELSDITLVGCEYSISWVYIATDKCGNQAQCLQTFTWTVDTEAPDITHCPSDMDLGCNPLNTDVHIVSPDFGIEATDNCGIASIDKIDVGNVIQGDDCLYYYYITYGVTDLCGNISTCSQRIFWTVDTTPPLITCPPNLELGCDPKTIPDPEECTVVAIDNCGPVTVEITASSISNDNGFIKMTRTYTATDQCGNTSSCDQMITWWENNGEVPDSLCPEDVNFGCVTEFPEFPPPLTDTTFESQGCSISRVHAEDHSHIHQLNNCEFDFDRVYFLINCCGDTTLCIQNFKWRMVNDTVSQFDLPEDQVAFCNIPPLPDYVSEGLCGPGIPIFLGQNEIGDCTDGNCIVERHWKVTSCTASLQILFTQTIEVTCEIQGITNQAIENSGKEPQKLDLNPNPVTNVLHLRLNPSLVISKITIMDFQGRKVKELSSSDQTESLTHQIIVDDLHPGMYTVTINGDKQTTQKFIKM